MATSFASLLSGSVKVSRLPNGSQVLVESKTIQCVLAQVDVHFSNSMIESWWRQLKHQWLYLNTLDSLETVRNLVKFFVEQHNEHVPHSAFEGQTPDEMYFGTGTEVPEKLQVVRMLARQIRREANLARSCSACRTEPQLVSLEQLAAQAPSIIPPNTS